MPAQNTRSREDQEKIDRKRRERIRNWCILIAVVVLAVAGVFALRAIGHSREVTCTQLICNADQDVTVFGNSVVYYDGISLHCVAPSGGIKWSYPVGSNARFSVSDTHIVAWAGAQLFIVDRNGKPSYNESMGSAIQFARINDHYCAVIIGSDTNPDLIVKSLDGTQVDEEAEAFNSMLLLDVGFFGDNDQYMWTLAMDVYGTAINSVLNTFQVGKMNTGEAALGEFLCYKVLYSVNKLYAFTTQRMFVFDYKAVQDHDATKLVYGWQFLDSSTTSRGTAMLLAPTAQLNGTTQTINDLRILTDNNDLRYTLPSACVGAVLQGNALYAVSSEYLYRTDIDTQRFSVCDLPIPEGREVTGFIGLTSDGHAIVTCGNNVYSVNMPW